MFKVHIPYFAHVFFLSFSFFFWGGITRLFVGFKGSPIMEKPQFLWGPNLKKDEHHISGSPELVIWIHGLGIRPVLPVNGKRLLKPPNHRAPSHQLAGS